MTEEYGKYRLKIAETILDLVSKGVVEILKNNDGVLTDSDLRFYADIISSAKTSVEVCQDTLALSKLEAERSVKTSL